MNLATKEDVDRLYNEIAALRAELQKPRVEPLPEWATIGRYAEIINCSESTVNRKIRHGELKAVPFGKVRMVKVVPDEVSKLRAKRGARSGTGN